MYRSCKRREILFDVRRRSNPLREDIQHKIRFAKFSDLLRTSNVLQNLVIYVLKSLL